MAKINCLKCEHYDKYRNKDCPYSFRRASGGAGQAVDNIRDVYRCLDYSEIKEDDEFDDEEDLEL